MQRAPKQTAAHLQASTACTQSMGLMRNQSSPLPGPASGPFIQQTAATRHSHSSTGGGQAKAAPGHPHQHQQQPHQLGHYGQSSVKHRTPAGAPVALITGRTPVELASGSPSMSLSLSASPSPPPPPPPPPASQSAASQPGGAAGQQQVSATLASHHHHHHHHGQQSMRGRAPQQRGAAGSRRGAPISTPAAPCPLKYCTFQCSADRTV